MKLSYFKFSLITAFAILLGGTQGYCETGAAHSITLFRPRTAAQEENQTHFRQTEQIAPAEYELEVDLNLLTETPMSSGSIIVFEPQPGVVMTAVVDRVSTDINQTQTIRARISSHDSGLLLLTVANNTLLSTIDMPEDSQYYLIRFDKDRQQYFSEPMKEDERDIIEGGPSLIPPATPQPEQESSSQQLKTFTALATTADEPLPASAQIDIMIVYTPAARSWAGGTSEMNNIIAHAMERGQTALDNSEIPVTLRLVHSAEISYTESGASGTDLTRLTNTSDGYMDEVHTWRNTYGADLVGLFTKVEDTGGLAWLLKNTNGTPTHAFSITRAQQAATSYTAIHEFGHNMGCHHHKAQNDQPGPGLYSYSAGWRWTGTNSSRYCSVMTYESGGYFADGLNHTRVAYFSNPDVSYMGAATGTATDDNARTIRNVMHVVANYRATAYGTFWVRAVALTNSVVLRWEDPLEYGVDNQTVQIRHNTTDYPASTNAGSLTYQGTNQVFEHTGLTPGQQYYYTIFISDDGTNFFDPD